MKRVLIVLLLCIPALLLAACGGKKNVETTADPATTAAPATTVAPATTAGQATTAEPATTAGQATTAEPTTTAAPATTSAPSTASPDGKVTLYGNGVNPVLILSSTAPASVRDGAVNSIRGKLRTRVGSAPKIASDAAAQAEVEFVFGETTREITARAKAYLPVFDENGDQASFVIYCDEDGIAVVWNHEYAATVGTQYFCDEYFDKESLKMESGSYYVGNLSVSEYEEMLRLEEEERLRQEEQARYERVERLFAERFDVIEDPTVRAAVKEFYDDFYDPEKLIRWWAGLYDPDLGGFYYANSARDNAGYDSGAFLPDMESTWQIVQRLRSFDKGGDLARFLGPEITAKMIKFYQDMQDPSDGYFYHPQWTKAESRANVMRYTRDQDWAIAALVNLHSAPLYPTALDRAKNSATSNVLSVQRLASPVGGVSVKAAGWTPPSAGSGKTKEQSVKEYVNNLLDTTSCEHWGNQLDTQISTFEAYDVLNYVIDVLDERINPDFGLWVRGYNESSGLYYNMRTSLSTETPYGIFTNTYKVMKCYNAAGRTFAYPSKMVENAFKAINLRDPGARVTYIFNPWATLAQLRENVDKYGTSASAAEYDALINANFSEILDSLKATLGAYRWEDGSYSFLQSGSSPTIYSTTVSLGLEEGDVNATNLVISLAHHICSALGLDDTIDVFNENHGKLMQQLLKDAPSVPKTGDPNASVSEEVCHDFSNGLPSGSTQTNKSGTTFSVVGEPGNASNKVVEINKNTEGDDNGAQLYIPLLTVDRMTNTTVLEVGMRLNVTDETRFGTEISNRNNPNIIQICLMCQSDIFWMPTLRFDDADDPTGYTFLVGKSTSGGAKEYPDNQEKVFQFGQWYEFTFRLTIKNLGMSNAEFRVEILVDGEYFGVSECFYSDSYSGNAVDAGSINFETGERVRVRFQPQMRIHAKILVDDVTAKVEN